MCIPSGCIKSVELLAFLSHSHCRYFVRNWKTFSSGQVFSELPRPVTHYFWHCIQHDCCILVDIVNCPYITVIMSISNNNKKSRDTGTNLVYHRSNCPFLKAFRVPVHHHLLSHFFQHQQHSVRSCFVVESIELALNHSGAVYWDLRLFLREGDHMHSVYHWLWCLEPQNPDNKTPSYTLLQFSAKNFDHTENCCFIFIT